MSDLSARLERLLARPSDASWVQLCRLLESSGDEGADALSRVEAWLAAYPAYPEPLPYTELETQFLWDFLGPWEGRTWWPKRWLRALAVGEGVPEVARLARRAHFSGGWYGKEGRLARALGAEALGELRELSIYQITFDEGILDALADSPCAKSLRRLSLVEGFLKGPQLARLFGRGAFPELRELRVSSRYLGLAGARALGHAAESLPALETLDLYSSFLGDEGVEQLVWGSLPRVRRLNLSHCSVGKRGIRALTRSDVGQQLRALDLTSGQVSKGGAGVLAGSPFPELEELNLDRSALSPQSLRELAESPCFPKLRALQLSVLRIDDESLRALADSAHYPHLEHLTLRNNPSLGDGAVRALAEARGLPALRSLDLSRTQITYRALEALANSSRALTRLSLDHDRVGGRGLRALARARFLPRLERLSLRQVGADPESLRALAEASPPSLRLLEMGDDPLDAPSCAALLRAWDWSELRYLRLGSLGLGDEGVEALTESGALPQLRYLGLASNGIGPRGAAALARTELPALRHLSLYENPLGPEGVTTLAASPALEGLRYLGLSSTGGDEAGALALAASPFVRGLAKLSLSDPIGAAGARAILSSENLIDLQELTAKQTDLHHRERYALEQARPELYARWDR